MQVEVELLDSALTTVETACDYIRAFEYSDRPHVARAVNEATAFMEQYTHRALKSREHTFRLDGDGTSVIVLPEWPITELVSVDSIGADGITATSIPTAGVAFDEGGVVKLAGGTFPWGKRNIAIKAICGYKPETHDVNLADLERSCLRMAQVFYQDWKNALGRTETISVGGNSATIAAVSMPEDVKASLDEYRRIY